MKRILVIAVLLIAAAAPASAQTMDKKADQNSKAEQEVLKVNKEYDEAIVRQDAAFYDRILADDYVYTNSDGKLVDKAQEMARVKSGDTKFESGQSDDVKVRVYGNMAVVTGRFTAKGQSKGKEFNETERYTTVYLKRQGRWQIVADQTTRIAQR